MRCEWASSNPYFYPYHDNEWGVPNHNDIHLFEMLCLEGAQAGLSWLTVLQKRDHYRKVFDSFDPIKIASYDDDKRTTLLSDPGIIRNKLKVNAFITNAREVILIQKEYGSFAKYIWDFTPEHLTYKDHAQANEASETMSRTLKKRGFTFVGPTICYSFMEATGMINNHSADCYRFIEIEKLII